MFNKRFSLPNRDAKHTTLPPGTRVVSLYEAINNSSEQFRNEINDIYFGAAYKYSFNGVPTVFGDVMGVQATEQQVNDIVRVQEEFGIPGSLTLNDMNHHMEVVSDKEIRDGLIKFIRGYYDKGIRVCTISQVHLMASGILQENFPDMIWKNTVNHLVRTAQEVVDYAALGYNVILLDRSLNRDYDELKKVKRAAALVNVKTSLLVTEHCLPMCPFKTEHDAVQPDSTQNYWTKFGEVSCGRWRHDGQQSPRMGTSIELGSQAQYETLFDLVDIMKFSGRLSSPVMNEGSEYGYAWDTKPYPSMSSSYPKQMKHHRVDSFKTAFDLNLTPLKIWAPLVGIANDPAMNTVVKEDFAKHVDNSMFSKWQTPKGIALSEILTTCKNQCWDCNACDKVFGQTPALSIVNRRPVNSAKVFSILDARK